MADDFGDDTGQRLCDWAVRIGMDEVRAGRGDRGLGARVDALALALERARDAAPGAGEAAAGRADGFAKLDMREFTALPGYDEVEAAIRAGLDGAGVWHGIHRDGGTTWLVFPAADAPEVSRCLGSLAGEAREAGRRAAEAVRVGRDSEPLDERASRAREASAAQRGAEAPSRERPRRRERAR